MAVPQREKYIADFEKLGFGMFVHWGLYSQLGRGEWVKHIENIDMAEYCKLKDSFTACDFDAEKMVSVAKKAGCKYITLTTRHHEGFSLFDTCGLNDFDAPHSPAGRDLIREFVDACRSQDIVPFFYHTTLDWYNKDFDENFDGYLEYLRKSVEILCTNYGEIGGFWFDGNWSKPDADWKEDELYRTIRKHQPKAIIVNNTGLMERGKVGNPEIDSVTFEQGKPTYINRDGMKKYVAAEMCHTVNDHWGVGKNDINYKSPRELIESLCDCRKVGANYLLNIGLEAQGGVNSYQEQLFGLISAWTGAFGEAIYDVSPYWARGMGNNFMLRSNDGKYLYIFVYDLGNRGDDNVTVGGKYNGSYAFGNVTDKISSVSWMDNGEQLDFISGNNMLCVNFTGFEYGKSYCVRVAKATIA